MRSAQAVFLRNKLYVGRVVTSAYRQQDTILIYDITWDSWRLIEGPARSSALTTHNDKLVLVGGTCREADILQLEWPWPTFTATNKLWTLQDDEQTFTQTLPPMPTARYAASAVSTDKHLIVAGGRDSNHSNLDEVEVYNGQQWMTTDPLPKTCCFMKSTYQNGYYYLMGGDYQGRSVYYVHLQSLIENAIHHPPNLLQYSKQQLAWTTLPDIHYNMSSTQTPSDRWSLR